MEEKLFFKVFKNNYLKNKILYFIKNQPIKNFYLINNNKNNNEIIIRLPYNNICSLEFMLEKGLVSMIFDKLKQNHNYIVVSNSSILKLITKYRDDKKYRELFVKLCYYKKNELKKVDLIKESIYYNSDLSIEIFIELVYGGLEKVLNNGNMLGGLEHINDLNFKNRSKKFIEYILNKLKTLSKKYKYQLYNNQEFVSKLFEYFPNHYNRNNIEKKFIDKGYYHFNLFESNQLILNCLFKLLENEKINEYFIDNIISLNDDSILIHSDENINFNNYTIEDIKILILNYSIDSNDKSLSLSEFKNWLQYFKTNKSISIDMLLSKGICQRIKKISEFRNHYFFNQFIYNKVQFNYISHLISNHVLVSFIYDSVFQVFSIDGLNYMISLISDSDDSKNKINIETYKNFIYPSKNFQIDQLSYIYSDSIKLLEIVHHFIKELETNEKLNKIKFEIDWILLIDQLFLNLNFYNFKILFNQSNYLFEKFIIYLDYEFLFNKQLDKEYLNFIVNFLNLYKPLTEIDLNLQYMNSIDKIIYIINSFSFPLIEKEEQLLKYFINYLFDYKLFINVLDFLKFFKELSINSLNYYKSKIYKISHNDYLLSIILKDYNSQNINQIIQLIKIFYQLDIEIIDDSTTLIDLLDFINTFLIYNYIININQITMVLKKLFNNLNNNNNIYKLIKFLNNLIIKFCDQNIKKEILDLIEILILESKNYKLLLWLFNNQLFQVENKLKSKYLNCEVINLNDLSNSDINDLIFIGYFELLLTEKYRNQFFSIQSIYKTKYFASFISSAPIEIIKQVYDAILSDISTKSYKLWKLTEKSIFYCRLDIIVEVIYEHYLNGFDRIQLEKIFLYGDYRIAEFLIQNLQFHLFSNKLRLIENSLYNQYLDVYKLIPIKHDQQWENSMVKIVTNLQTRKCFSSIELLINQGYSLLTIFKCNNNYQTFSYNKRDKNSIFSILKDLNKKNIYYNSTNDNKRNNNNIFKIKERKNKIKKLI